MGNYTGPGIGRKTIDFGRLNYLRNIDVKSFFKNVKKVNNENPCYTYFPKEDYSFRLIFKVQN